MKETLSDKMVNAKGKGKVAFKKDVRAFIKAVKVEIEKREKLAQELYTYEDSIVPIDEAKEIIDELAGKDLI